ncbi:MAG: hypothetical protein ABEJ66_02245, partial [Candidatus Nanohaloarchaea archaeon]
LVNETLENAGSYDYHKLDSDKLGFLNVTLQEPPNDTVVVQNRSFVQNVSVTCENGECGTVTVSPRYKRSSTADTLVPEGSGEPFHTNTSNTKTCDSSLKKGETCFTSWFVNATGTLESYHLLDVNASSSYSQVESNDSIDHLVQINTALIINLSFDAVHFGPLEPGAENNSAVGNSNLSYNLTVDEDSNTVDKLWTRATTLEGNDSSYEIGPSNLSYSQQNDISTEKRYSGTYQLVEK